MKKTDQSVCVIWRKYPELPAFEKTLISSGFFIDSFYAASRTELVAEKTPWAKRAKAIIEQGMLLTDELILEFAERWLPKLPPLAIISDKPSSVPQAEGFDLILRKLERSETIIVLVKPSTDFYMTNRHQQKAGTDRSDKFYQERFENYYQRVMPIFEYYSRNDRSIVMDPEYDSQESLIAQIFEKAKLSSE